MSNRSAVHDNSASNIPEALRNQRATTARRVTPLRLGAVAILWFTSLALGWDLRLASAYLAIAAATYVLARRNRLAAELSGYAIAFFDIPVIYLLQRDSPPTAAGVTVAIFVALVTASLLALDTKQTVATVVSGSVFGVLLQHQAGIALGGQLTTPLVLGLTGVAGHILSSRLLDASKRLLEGTQQKQVLESHLQHADRMAMMGMLSASVAHEVGNPLTYLLGNIELMRVKLERDAYDKDQFIDHLDEAATGAQRIARIVRDMRQMARKEDAQTLKEVDIRRVLEGTLNIARGEIRQRAQLEVEYGDMPGVVASETRLSQVFLNLLVNAAQAIPEGRNDQKVRVVTGTGRNGEAFISVTDTGSGITPENKERLFTPFFTTKGRENGTGLGLSICARLVQTYGGRIEVDSEPGKGSTFRVLLPPLGAGPLADAVTIK